MFVIPKIFAIPLILMVSSLTLTSCSDEEDVQVDTALEISTHEAFFETIRSLCGQEFYGETTFPDNPEHEMVGAELYMHVSSCEENEIRIPFHVNENTSRTWILTLDDEDLLLKHDHRHSDGTPEDLTNYGGYANQMGDAYRQFFPADQETARMLPAASSNVWMMEVDLDEMKFIYYLERHNAPRYQAEFSLINGLE